MKAIARGFYTPYDLNTILWYHKAFFFSHLSNYPLLELAVALLEAVEFSSRSYVGRSLPLVIILRKGASSFHFCSNCFPGKLLAQISMSFKSSFLFIPQDLKHFTFFRKFLLYKTKSQYLLRLVCLRGG